MELMDFAVLGIVSAGFSLVFSALCGYVTVWLRDYRVARLEAQVQSLTMARNNDMAQNKRAQMNEEEAAFMAQAQAILAGEGDMAAKIQKVIAANPAMAMRLAKKLGIGL